MVFFTVPKKLKERVQRVKDGEQKNKKNIIKLFQNEAWISSINRGHANGCVEYSDNAKFRTCLN